MVDVPRTSPARGPSFAPFQSLPEHAIDSNFACSRMPGGPKRYLPDLMRDRAADSVPLLADPNACLFVGNETRSTPTLSCLQRVALGGGVGLARACDIALAAMSACFSANVAKLAEQGRERFASFLAKRPADRMPST